MGDNKRKMQRSLHDTYNSSSSSSAASSDSDHSSMQRQQCKKEQLRRSEGGSMQRREKEERRMKKKDKEGNKKKRAYKTEPTQEIPNVGNDLKEKTQYQYQVHEIQPQVGGTFEDVFLRPQRGPTSLSQDQESRAPASGNWARLRQGFALVRDGASQLYAENERLRQQFAAAREEAAQLRELVRSLEATMEAFKHRQLSSSSTSASPTTSRSG